MIKSAWSQKEGFTLVEVLAAMMVLGIGILGFMALQTAAVTTRVQAQNMTTATQLTSALLDELIRTHTNVLADGNRTVSIGSRSYTQTWTVQRNAPVGGLITINAQTNWSQKNQDRFVNLSAVVSQ